MQAQNVARSKSRRVSTLGAIVFDVRYDFAGPVLSSNSTRNASFKFESAGLPATRSDCAILRYYSTAYSRSDSFSRCIWMQVLVIDVRWSTPSTEPDLARRRGRGSTDGQASDSRGSLSRDGQPEMAPWGRATSQSYTKSVLLLLRLEAIAKNLSRGYPCLKITVNLCSRQLPVYS